MQNKNHILELIDVCRLYWKICLKGYKNKTHNPIKSQPYSHKSVIALLDPTPHHYRTSIK